jgi:hypothetical protein
MMNEKRHETKRNAGRDEKWMPTVDAECRRSNTCNE